jgi:6-phosphogluconolactonase (cycloisomerase 2 family)
MFHLRRPFLMGLALTVASVLARTQTTEAASKQILPGAVFALTNKPEGNEVIAFDRALNGALTQTGRYATGGYGIGSDFDTQGGLVLSDDHHFLYACNPGSDSLTVFGVNGSQLTFLQKVAAGDEPLSITMSGKLLYVLDGSVAATQITGFTVAGSGTLTPLPGSTKALSSPIAVPGEVLFSPDGRLLAVTHKVPGRFGPTLDTFQIDSDGLPGDPVPNQSFGMRPFAEAFRKDGRLVVVESGLPTVNNSGVSSYEVSEGTGLLAAITSVKNN